MVSYNLNQFRHFTSSARRKIGALVLDLRNTRKCTTSIFIFSRTLSENKVRRLEMETAVTFLENGDRWYNLRDWERVCEFGVNCSKRLRSINENSVVPFYMYLLHCVSFSSKFVKVDFSFSFSLFFFKYFFILTSATITRRS